MKKTQLLLSVVIFCFGLMTFFLPLKDLKAKENIINLRFANYLPPQTGHTKLCEEFIKDLEERTGGRINVKFFKGGSLLKGPSMYKGVVTGVADIGFSHIYYTPGRMPLTELAGLPLGLPNAWVTTHVLNDFYLKFRPKEWDNVKVLWLAGPATAVISTKNPVRKMEDLKGMTLRAPGIVGEIVKALGASPAPTPMIETYEGISKGVLDGYYANYDVLKSFRLAEVTKYSTICPQIGSAFPFYAIMNKNSYKKLPSDLKEIFDTLCGEYREKFALMWNQLEVDSKDFAAANGIKEFITIHDKEADKWADAVEVVIEGQINKLVKNGFSESDVRNMISFLKDRTQYYLKKQIKYRIP